MPLSLFLGEPINAKFGLFWHVKTFALPYNSKAPRLKGQIKEAYYNKRLKTNVYIIEIYAEEFPLFDDGTSVFVKCNEFKITRPESHLARV